jgi:hypothetical protein
VDFDRCSPSTGLHPPGPIVTKINRRRTVHVSYNNGHWADPQWEINDAVAVKPNLPVCERVPRGVLELLVSPANPETSCPVHCALVELARRGDSHRAPS